MALKSRILIATEMNLKIRIKIETAKKNHLRLKTRLSQKKNALGNRNFNAMSFRIRLRASLTTKTSISSQTIVTSPCTRHWRTKKIILFVSRSKICQQQIPILVNSSRAIGQYEFWSLPKKVSTLPSVGTNKIQLVGHRRKKHTRRKMSCQSSLDGLLDSILQSGKA